MTEAPVLKRTMIAASKQGQRLLRNSRGQFYTMGSVKVLIKAALGLDIKKIREAVKLLRQTRAGLEAEGSSDLIGITTITITQEMVGRRAGIATVIECKAAGWQKPSDAREKAQANFIDQVVKRGGIGAFVDDEKKLKNILDSYFPPL